MQSWINLDYEGCTQGSNVDEHKEILYLAQETKESSNKLDY